MPLVIDIYSPEIRKAVQLAEKLVIHCKENNIPDTSEIFGVSLNAHALYNKAFESGKLHILDKLSAQLELLKETI